MVRRLEADPARRSALPVKPSKPVPACAGSSPTWRRCLPATSPTPRPGIYPVPENEDGGLRRHSCAQPRVLPRRAGGRAAARRGDRRAKWREAKRRKAAGLLSAELPLPVGRLADGGVRAPLRHAGGGALLRRRERHAPAGAGADGGGAEGPRPAPPRLRRHRLRDRARSCARCGRPSRASPLSRSISPTPISTETMRRLGRRPKIQPVVAKAEALPLADASLDLAT